MYTQNKEVHVLELLMGGGRVGLGVAVGVKGVSAAATFRGLHH